MHNHAEGTDPFDDFARRDLEEKGVEPETAERVVSDTYGETGRAYRAGYEAGTSAAKQTSDRPEGRDDFGRVANKIRAALEEELRGASPEYLTGFNSGMHDVWFEWLQEDPPDGVPARATPRPWEIHHAGLTIAGVECGSACRPVATVFGVSGPQWEADAALIVRAVNSHDQLVDALEALTAFAALYTGNGANRDESELADTVSNGPDQWVDLARAALAKARGES